MELSDKDIREITQLESNSYIIDQLTNLIYNLSKNDMTSTCNGYVKDYFDNINLVIVELAEYDSTLNIIEQCLIKHHWQKNNFIMEPIQNELCMDLLFILNRML